MHPSIFTALYANLVDVFADFVIKYAAMTGGVLLSNCCATEIRNKEVFIVLLFNKSL